MHKIVISAACGIMALLIFAISNAVAQDAISGHWEGAVSRDGAVQIIGADFQSDGQNLKGTIQIPELGLFDEPLTEVCYEHPMLKFKFLYGHFTCIVHSDVAEITGGNDKWGPPVRLHLKRGNAAFPRHRTENVSFTNGTVTLAGSVWVPTGSGPHPAVVLIHGSGPQGRKEWLYRGTANFLVRDGIATLIYDKRGVGESKGDWERATFAELAEDALAGVRYLKTRKDINRSQIGLFGSSQGGWIAPLAATQSSDVAFVILNAGPAVSVWEQERHRVKYTMRSEEFSENDIKAALALTEDIFKVAKTGRGWDSLSSGIEAAKNKKWTAHVQLPASKAEAQEWSREQYDPAPILSKLKCPVLALFGGADTIVPPTENIDLLRRYLRDAGNKDLEIKVFPNVGHNMELSRTLKEGRWKWPEAYWVWPRKAPGYYETITTWLAQHLNRAR